MTEHYLDNSATTPLCEAAIAKMTDVMKNTYGNPSSLHTLGVHAEAVMTEARTAILRALCPVKTGIRPKPDQLIFTASGTEANNLALIGAATAKTRNKGKKIIIGETEHPSVIETANHLESLGFQVVKIPSPNGIWDMEAYRSALTPDTILVSAMLVNNETGAVNDIKAISAMARAKNPDILIHCDAVQGFLKIDVTPVSFADMVTISAHKIGGPKGIGALYVSEKVLKTKALVPVIFGGGQEKGLRSGTENVIGMAGFGAAAADTSAKLPSLFSTWKTLRKRLEDGIVSMENPDLRINTPKSEKIAEHIVSLTAKGIRSETLLHSLSAEGVYVSSGSACSSNTGHASYVLHSFGLSDADADSTIRISFGNTTTEEDIDALLSALKNSLARLARTTKRR